MVRHAVFPPTNIRGASSWCTSQTYCFYCFPRSFVLLLPIVLHQLCLLHQVGASFVKQERLRDENDVTKNNVTTHRENEIPLHAN